MPAPALQALARAIRRVAMGALFDRDFAPDEYRVQLRVLIEGYTAERALEQPLQGGLAS